MKHFLAVVFFLFLFLSQSFTQKIHWADEVEAVSSEYNDPYRYFAKEQILGVPNAISEKDLSPWAWQPKKPNAGKEYIRVSYNNAVRGVRQVYISESRAPGAITKIILHEKSGKKHVVYENKFPKGLFKPFRMFRVTFPPTSYYVKEVTVEMNTKAVPGANLDAIGITDYYGEIKIKKQINNIQYASTVPNKENLGRQVNSNYAERLPIISPDGNTLYFTRKFHPDNMGAENRDDIWVSQRMPNGNWGYAENIGEPLNNTDHNYVVAINPTGTSIYLGNKYRSKSQGLSMSSPKRGAWAKPFDLKIANFYNNNVFAEYHVSVDEKVLLLSIERTDGYGERDLYVSFHKGEGSWSQPKNLGSTINTNNIENSVFLAADGKTLYFCSNGHYNYGGLDVFVSERLDDSWTNWTEPKNLGPKINTNGNDLNFTIPASGEYAYFSSDDNSFGMSDLFRIRLPEEAKPDPVMLVTGRIVDATTNQPIQAKVKYNPLEKIKKEEDKEIAAGDDGSYQVVLPYGKDMEVYADLDGYYAISESMELGDENLEELDGDDPNDPLLKKFEYQETPPSKEELALERKLAQLEQELADLKKKKSEPLAYDAPYTKTQAQQSVYPQPKPRTYSQPKYNPRPKDSELDYLKQKYYDQMRNKPQANTPQRDPANKNGKEVNDMYSKLYGKKDREEEERRNPTKNPASKDDKEVNDMYSKLYGKKDKEEKPKKDPFAPSETEPTEPTETATTEPSEPVEQPGKEAGEPEEIAATEPDEDFEGSGKDYYEIPSFEDFEQEVRQEMRQELTQQIRAELRKELMDEIKRELEKDANQDEEELLDDVVSEVKRENQKELSEIPRLEADVSNDNEIELELKQLIVAEMKEELKEELEAPIKEELKNEVSLKVKEKEKDETQKKMDEWKKRRQNSSSSRPVAQAKPKKDPEYVELNQDIKVVPIKVGQVIPMNNIFFDANKSSIKEQSNTELQRVLTFLTTNGNLVVEVGGHTNGWCSSSFADELSRGRAREVMEYFVENGVPRHRIQYRGYGKTMPIATNDTLAGRKKNQRVELKILEILND